MDVASTVYALSFKEKGKKITADFVTIMCHDGVHMYSSITTCAIAGTHRFKEFSSMFLGTLPTNVGMQFEVRQEAQGKLLIGNLFTKKTLEKTSKRKRSDSASSTENAPKKKKK